MATLAETLPTVTITFDEQDVERVHVIIQVDSFHYTYRFLLLWKFLAKRATNEVDMVICVVCTSVRPAVSRFPHILPQENLDGLRQNFKCISANGGHSWLVVLNFYIS